MSGAFSVEGVVGGVTLLTLELDVSFWEGAEGIPYISPWVAIFIEQLNKHPWIIETPRGLLRILNGDSPYSHPNFLRIILQEVVLKGHSHNSVRGKADDKSRKARTLMGAYTAGTLFV